MMGCKAFELAGGPLDGAFLEIQGGSWIKVPLQVLSIKDWHFPRAFAGVWGVATDARKRPAALYRLDGGKWRFEKFEI